MLGRKIFAAAAGIVPPDAVTRWYRRFAAKKYDGFEDQRRCRDPDKDKDGVPDPWVAKKGCARDARIWAHPTGPVGPWRR